MAPPKRQPVICIIEECAKPAQAWSMCRGHYGRVKAHGDPHVVLNGRGLSPIEKFTQRYIVNDAGCWLWTAGTNDGGYGRFSPQRPLTVAAHRWSYEHFVGPIPDGATIDHLCRTRLCVNPRHLEAVSIRENLMRGDTPAARNARKTHCPNGHPYDDSNTRMYRGQRHCRACHNRRVREYYARERSKRR